MLALIAIAELVVVRLSRYPEWDEAVFLSQSGGFQGIESEPSALVASREIGTHIVLGVLRLINPSLGNTRILWMTLSFSILLLGIVLLGRVLEFPPLAGAAFAATYWLSFSFGSSFFSFFIAGSCMVLAAGIYLSLRQTSRHTISLGVVLGVVLSAALWFRQIEGALFATVVLLHSLVVAPRMFWSRRLWGAASAAVSLGVGFVIPWTIDSIQRFGSVGGRLASGREQSFERGVSNQLFEYLGTLRGQSQTYGSLAPPPPTWAVTLISVFLLAGLVAAAASAIHAVRLNRRARDAEEVAVGGLSFLWLAGACLTGFFMFFIGEVTDRYMVAGATFLLLAILATTWPYIEEWGRKGEAAEGVAAATMNVPKLVLVGLFGLWLIANATIATTYEQARFASGRAMQSNVATIRALTEGMSCQGVSRYGAPQVEFGTGCDVRSAGNAEVAHDILDRQNREGGFRFILWPERDADSVAGALGVGAQSMLLESVPGHQGLVLHFVREGREGREGSAE